MDENSTPLGAVVSVFRNALDVTPVGHRPIRKVLEYIRDGFYREKVERLRTILAFEGGREYNDAKLNLPAFSMSAHLTTRAEKTPLSEKLVAHSGLLQVDLDKVEDVEVLRAKINADPHTAFSFLSPSGEGLKIGIVIDGNMHLESFRAAQRYYKEEYELTIDPSVTDVARLCFVSYDPCLYANPSPKPFDVDASPSEAPLHDFSKESSTCSDLDSPHNVARATEFLLTCPPAVEGSYGDDRTVKKTVMPVRDLGVSEEMCYSLMLTVFNPRCTPCWEPSNLRKKVRSGYKSAQLPIGNRSPEADFEVLSRDPNEDRPFPASSLHGEPPKREWLVEGWVPKGEVCSFYGNGGMGKSMVALHMACTVSLGDPFFQVPTLRCPTLMVTTEDDEGELHRRLDRILPFGFGDLQNDLMLWPRPGKDSILASFSKTGKMEDTPFHEKLLRELRTLGSSGVHKFIILDTLADIFAGNEISRSEVSQFIKGRLRRLCETENCTIMFVAHPSRAGATNGDLYSGSTAWHNSVRARLTLTDKARKSDLIRIKILENIKSNYSSAGNKILLNYANGCYHRIDDEEVFVDDVLEGSIEMVFCTIEDAARKKEFLSVSKRALNYVGDALPSMDAQDVIACCKILEKSGRVINVTGKKHGNGLRPKSENSDYEF